MLISCLLTIYVLEQTLLISLRRLPPALRSLARLLPVRLQGSR